MNQLINRAQDHLERIAIISNNNEYSYSDLLQASEQVAQTLLQTSEDLDEARVGFMVQPGFNYVKVQWGIWRAGGIAVPICVSYPAASIAHVLDDAGCSTVLMDREFEQLLLPLCNERALEVFFSNEFESTDKGLPAIEDSRSAMILYTSGTTGKPKGVVTTHSNIAFQIKTLVKAWNWSSDDHILNVLPLHHVHGIINVLSCALWSGACCEFNPKFDAQLVLNKFLQGRINVFMAVPTIYYKLIAYWETLNSAQKEQIKICLSKFRLMISGSAALPVSVMENWKEISDQTLLERYGMTEIGMAISNPYDGERRAGHIGQPLPGVQVRLVDETGNDVKQGDSGEILVKGNNVFKSYWNRPEATTDAFTNDGWFKTGDIATTADGYYKIIGRNSVDIIKSGGYKISALEIEEVLRTHPDIKDCGVVGIPDPEWDEIIGASLVLSADAIDLEALKSWIKELLPGYKTPRKYLLLEDLPRNVMGKVTKNELKKLFIEKQTE